VHYHIDDSADDDLDLVAVLSPRKKKEAAAKAAAAAEAKTAAATSETDGAAASATAAAAADAHTAELKLAASAATRAQRVANLKEVGQTCFYLIFIMWPCIVGILMALYYLYVAYGEREVWAFAVIWLLFVASLVGGLVYTWQQRVKEQRIIEAQLAEEEAKAQHFAVNVATPHAAAAAPADAASPPPATGAPKQAEEKQD
jgi:hypothetical protein